MISNNYKVYGLEKIEDDSFLTLVGSIGFICNAFSKLLWSNLFDRFGFKRVYSILIIVEVKFTSLLYFILSKAAIVATMNFISGTKILYLLWFGIAMATDAGQYAIMPAETAKVFGVK